MDFTRKRNQDNIEPAKVRGYQLRVMLNSEELELLDIVRGSLSRAEATRFLMQNNMPAPVPELNALIWEKLARSSSNINQIARHLNSGGGINFEEIKVDIEEFRASLIFASASKTNILDLENE